MQTCGRSSNTKATMSMTLRYDDPAHRACMQVTVPMLVYIDSLMYTV